MSQSGGWSPSGKETVLKRISLAMTATVLIAGLVSAALPDKKAYAAQITNRSLTLEPGTTDGGSKIGGVVKHRFKFDIPTSGTLGSIKFEYCTTASVEACVLPAGVVTTGSTLTIDTTPGASIVSNFTLNNSTNGAPYVTRTAAAVTAGTETLTLNTVTNPTVANGTTFYVRISTYASNNATGSPIDTGSVAAATTTQIELTGTMPESLIFCAGAEITVTANVPNCASVTTGAVTFNQLFSPSDTAHATSMFAASTNATTGYNVTVAGTTLTSGANTISPMASAATSARGTGQFGLNLKANTTTASTPFGAELTPASDGTNLKGNPAAGYTTAETFKFVTGDIVAKSDSNGAGGTGTNGPTNAQAYTASYIVNVPGNQFAGTYTTTLTYVCTASF